MLQDISFQRVAAAFPCADGFKSGSVKSECGHVEKESQFHNQNVIKRVLDLEDSSSFVVREQHRICVEPLQSAARNERPRFSTECADTDVVNSIQKSQNLHSQSTDSIFVHTKYLGEPNPSSSTRRKMSTQHNQPGSQTRGTGTRRNVRRENVTYLAASSGDDVSRVSPHVGNNGDGSSYVHNEGISFGDGAARVGSPKVSTSSPLVSPSSIINVPRELYSIDVAATFRVPLTTVGDLQKLINDMMAVNYDELLSELTNEDVWEILGSIGILICNSIKVARTNADGIPCWFRGCSGGCPLVDRKSRFIQEMVDDLGVTPNAEKTNDGFQTVGKKKKRKSKSKSTNGGQFTGPSTTGNSSKKDNLSMSNSFSALNEEEEEDEEDVENVYDESANLIQNTKAGRSSSFTAAAG
ncbi:hypothetical protein Tco_0755774 [Tanacetum coccineum]